MKRTLQFVNHKIGDISELGDGVGPGQKRQEEEDDDSKYSASGDEWRSIGPSQVPDTKMGTPAKLRNVKAKTPTTSTKRK